MGVDFFQAIDAEDKNWRRGHPREKHNHQTNNCTPSLSSYLWPTELGTEPGSWHCAWAGDGLYHLLLCNLGVTNTITQFNTCINWWLFFPPILAPVLKILLCMLKELLQWVTCMTTETWPSCNISSSSAVGLQIPQIPIPVSGITGIGMKMHWEVPPLCLSVCVCAWRGGVITIVACSEKWIPLCSGFCHPPPESETITRTLGGVWLSVLQFHELPINRFLYTASLISSVLPFFPPPFSVPYFFLLFFFLSLCFLLLGDDIFVYYLFKPQHFAL